MDWQPVEDLGFKCARALGGAVVMVVCGARALMMDQRARVRAQWTYTSLGMSAAGMVLSFAMPPWMHHGFVLWFLFSVVALILDGQTEWRDKVPDRYLRPEHRWPQKERRSGQDRRQPGGRRDGDAHD